MRQPCYAESSLLDGCSAFITFAGESVPLYTALTNTDYGKSLEQYLS